MGYEDIKAQDALKAHRRVTGSSDTGTPEYSFIKRIKDFFTDKQNYEQTDKTKVGFVGGGAVLGALSGFVFGGNIITIIIGSLLGTVAGVVGADQLANRLNGNPKPSKVPLKWDEPDAGTEPNQGVVKDQNFSLPPREIEVDESEVQPADPSKAPPADPSKVPPADPSKVPPADPSKVPPAEPSKVPPGGEVKEPPKPAPPKKVKVKVEGFDVVIPRYDPEEEVKGTMTIAHARQYVEKFKKEVLDSMVLNPVAENRSPEEQKRAAAAEALRREMTIFATQTNQREVDARFAAERFIEGLKAPREKVKKYFERFPKQHKEAIDKYLSLELKGEQAIAEDLKLNGKLPTITSADGQPYDLDQYGLEAFLSNVQAVNAKGGTIIPLTDQEKEAFTAMWHSKNVVQKRIFVTNHTVDMYKLTGRLLEQANMTSANMTPDDYLSISGVNVPDFTKLQTWKGGSDLRKELDAQLAAVRKYGKRDDWWDNPDAAREYLKLSEILSRVASQPNLDAKTKAYVESFMHGNKARAMMININIATKEKGVISKQWEGLDVLTQVTLPKEINPKVDKYMAFKETGVLFFDAREIEDTKEEMYRLLDGRKLDKTPEMVDLVMVYKKDSAGQLMLDKSGQKMIDKIIYITEASEHEFEIVGAEAEALFAKRPSKDAPMIERVNWMTEVIDKGKSKMPTKQASASINLDMLQAGGNSLVYVDMGNTDVVSPITGLPQPVKPGTEQLPGAGNRKGGNEVV